MANYHLVILQRPYLEAILVGQKQIESRFTKTKHAPFGQVQAEDKLFLKQSCGPVCATATVARVKTFENLTPQKILKLKEQYNHLILGKEQYWQSKTDCRFGVLVWLKEVKVIRPIRIAKKDWRAWVILTESENFKLLDQAG